MSKTTRKKIVREAEEAWAKHGVFRSLVEAEQARKSLMSACTLVTEDYEDQYESAKESVQDSWDDLHGEAIGNWEDLFSDLAGACIEDTDVGAKAIKLVCQAEAGNDSLTRGQLFIVAEALASYREYLNDIWEECAREVT